jgi:Asp-tRNA(Asn)/Glu-tRNA(Gln) amidotransferase A subunit family amidase
LPYSKINGLPWGINLNCKQFADQTLLNIAHTIELQLENQGVHYE